MLVLLTALTTAACGDPPTLSPLSGTAAVPAPSTVATASPVAAVAVGTVTSVQSLIAPNMCVTVSGAQVEGAILVISTCRGAATQQFVTTAAGEIRTVDNALCVDAFSGYGNDGDTMGLWRCHGESNQRWRIGVDAQIVGINEKCADVSGAVGTDQSRLTIQPCHGGQNQRFAVGGVVRTVPSSLALSRDTLTIDALGATVQVTATIQPVLPTAPPVTWTSVDTAVATVSATGAVTARGVGTTVIRGVVGSLADSARVTVRPRAASVALNAATATLVVGQSTRLVATVRDSLGSTLAGARVSWSTAHAHVATVAADGLVTAVAPGITTVSAVAGGKSTTTNVTVTAPALSQLVLTPAAVSLAAGSSHQFTATGVWSDTAARVIAPTYLATGGTVTAAGVYTAGSTPGVYRLIASALDRADTSMITVSAPTLSSLVMTPAALTIPAGAKQQLTVAARWSDGSTTLPPVAFSATGGTVTSGGLFTAGSAAGTFRVIVQHAGGTRTDTTAIVVTVPSPLRTLLDQEFYSKGQYGAFASPWSTFFDSSLRRGIDYSDSILVNTSSFTESTSIRWHWPDRVPTVSGVGVWGYMHVFFGNFAGGETAVRVQPRQAKSVTTLRQDFALAYTSTGSFNILNEFYLTSQAGNAEAKVIEIGYFLHLANEGKAYYDQGRLLGSYRDVAGRVWEARMQGTFCMLLPTGGADILAGSIDVKETLAFLIAKGVITGDEWFNGIGIGVEPVRGSGTLRLDKWLVTYQ